VTHGLPLTGHAIVTVEGVRPASVVVLAGCLLTILGSTGCTSSSGTSAANGCAHPTVTASTKHTIGVGAPGAPRIGPLTFHPYPYTQGYPLKMLIHAVSPQRWPIVLRGYRCSDALALRFRYGGGASDQRGPFSPDALEALGVKAQTLRPLPSGEDHTGYVLPTSPGKWLIVVTQAGASVGALRLDVEP